MPSGIPEYIHNDRRIRINIFIKYNYIVNNNMYDISSFLKERSFKSWPFLKKKGAYELNYIIKYLVYMVKNKTMVFFL